MASAQAETTVQEPIRFSADGVYGEILNFLIDEAALLDQDRQVEWMDYLTDDILYQMPHRHMVYRRDGRGFGYGDYRFNDDRQKIDLRVRRNTLITGALDRDPPPRTNRMISNVVAHQGDKPDEYRVLSSILLLTSQLDSPVLYTVSAKREDVIRRTPAGLKLARRVIYTDQVNLGNSYANVFM